MLHGALIGCGFSQIQISECLRDIAARDGSATSSLFAIPMPSDLGEVAAAFGISRTYTDAAEMLERETLELRRYLLDRPQPPRRSLNWPHREAAGHCQKAPRSPHEDARAIVDACDKAGCR
ncbi:hypothetical protein F2981_24220 (plasmid) [Sinorhizobium meliloti]|nr:hypothetical protein [Sinorhizobium meliloti]